MAALQRKVERYLRHVAIERGRSPHTVAAYRRDLTAFLGTAAAAGATSMIVSDVPAGQRPELRRVHLVAPTSTDERIRLAAESTDGWLYLVTLTGTTGARAELSSALEGLVARTRPLADGVPLYAGFGISTPEFAVMFVPTPPGNTTVTATGVP